MVDATPPTMAMSVGLRPAPCRKQRLALSQRLAQHAGRSLRGLAS